MLPSLKDFTHGLKIHDYFVKHIKMYHGKVLCSRFRLNGYTFFHSFSIKIGTEWVRYRLNNILIFQEDEKNQDFLNEKLSKLNRKEHHDPVLALGRDSIYEEELWEEHFEEWESGKNSFDHVVKSNASQLCAVAAMRTIEMAHAQHEKYIKTYKSLEKTGRSYRKVCEIWHF